MLLHDETLQDNDLSPFVSSTGFKSFENLEAILQAMEWFLMTIYHDDWYSHTLLYRVIQCIKHELNKLNLRPFYSMDHSNPAAITYGCINSVHNAFAILASLASNMAGEQLKSAYFSTDSNNTPMQDSSNHH